MSGRRLLNPEQVQVTGIVAGTADSLTEMFALIRESLLKDESFRILDRLDVSMEEVERHVKQGAA